MKTVVTSSRRRKPSSKKALLITVGALLAVIVALAVWQQRKNQNNDTKPEETTVQKIPSPVLTGPKEADTKPSSTNTFAQQISLTDEDASAAKPAKKIKISKEQEKLRANYVYPTPGQAKLPDGFIVTFKVPEDGHTVKFVVDHDRYICNPDGTYEIIKYTPIFEDKFEEQMINFSMPGGSFIPFVLLNHTEEELNAMLNREVVINPDDSDEVKEKKQAVAEMKVMLKEYLADGGNFVDFVNEMHKYSKEERKLRTKGLSRIEDLLERGEINEAKEFLKQYNVILGENNFPPMRLPKRIKELIGETRASEEPVAEDGMIEDGK